jgi:hypothetical protein
VIIHCLKLDKMKTTKNSLYTDESTIEVTQKEVKARKGLKYLLILFIISWIAVLPSCAVAVRTPEPAITIESHQHRLYRGNHYHHSHNEYRDRDDHRR